MDILNLFRFGEEEETVEPVTESDIDTDEETVEEQETMEDNPDEATKEDVEADEEPYRVYRSKDDWQKEFDGIIGKRLKDQRQQQEKLNAYEAKLSEIAAVYGTDINGLDEKINKLLEDKAYDEGTTPENLKARLQRDREYAQLKEMQQQLEHQENLRKFESSVAPEIDALKKKRPRLYDDLSVESITANPLFVELLANGYTLEKAYEMLNVDKVKDYVRRSTRATVANNIKARGARPSEGAAMSAGSGASHIDVTKLTREELQSIKERVRRGEKITFKT